MQHEIILKNKEKQAEAELGQAQPRLELDVRNWVQICRLQLCFDIEVDLRSIKFGHLKSRKSEFEEI